MTKEQKLITELTKVLCHMRVDCNMALNDDWDRSDDGFIAQLDMIEPILDKVEKYDKGLFDLANKEPKAYMDDLEAQRKSEED